MLKLSDFSLSGVKTFRGREGTGCNAFIVLNGKKIAEVLDDASGGEVSIHFVGEKGYFNQFDPPKEVAEFLAGPEAVKLQIDREMAFRKQYPELYKDEPLPTKWCPEDFFEYLFEHHQDHKELQKLAKRYGFVFRVVGEKNLRYFKIPKNYVWSGKGVDDCVKIAKQKHGNIEILATPEIPLPAVPAKKKRAKVAA